MSGADVSRPSKRTSMIRRCPVAQRRPKRCGRDREKHQCCRGRCCPGNAVSDDTAVIPEPPCTMRRQPASIAFGRSAYRDVARGDNDSSQRLTLFNLGYSAVLHAIIAYHGAILARKSARANDTGAPARWQQPCAGVIAG